MSMLSIVIPVFNEEGVLDLFYERLRRTLAPLAHRFEILFVDDGSSDRTTTLIRDLRDADPRIGLIALSRNFGKEMAMTAGLDHARGDAVIVIDADLQDPPELIPRLIEGWQQGYEVVYAQRVSRRGEPLLKRLTAFFFYRIATRMSRVSIPRDTGDFRLMSRRAVDALSRLREQHRFMKGLFAWIGYRQLAVTYHREPRAAGTTKWNYWRLWNFAIDGFTSFTTFPLKVATYLGVFTAIFSLLYGLFLVIDTITSGNPVPGYPSLMVAVLFFGGVQLLFLGVIGEYLGRMFDETKQRPLYLIQETLPAGPADPAGPAAPDAARAPRRAGP